ncbi:MAG: OsmC family protein [Reyranella sp.]|uniref:OsmC family protein n=1 Tax=Reyranella sp. TaxID=1929291 RepID=UPI003D0F587E
MSDTGNSLPPGMVLVEGADGPFGETVRSGPHVLRADEPVEAGGNDSGPGPYAYLLAALGTCTAMTVRLYARQKKWPLTDVRVRLSHDRIHATDCAECETREGRIDRIEKVIELVGQLDDGQRQRLLQIAERCPVHRTLVSEIRIESRLA